MDYICIKSPNSRGTIELPLEDDGSLLLTTLTSQFPDAIGLTFYCESSQGTRGLKLNEGKLWSPRGGWSNIIYSCTSIKGKNCYWCISISMHRRKLKFYKHKQNSKTRSGIFCLYFDSNVWHLDKDGDGSCKWEWSVCSKYKSTEGSTNHCYIKLSLPCHPINIPKHTLQKYWISKG